MKEEELSHGAVHTASAALSRTLSPHWHEMARVSAPYDWGVPYGLEERLISAAGEGFVLDIEDQGQAGSCGAEATGYVREALGVLYDALYERVSRRDAYSQVWYPGSGTSVAALNALWTSKGVTTEALIPSYPPSGPATEEFMRTRVQTDATRADALARKLPRSVPVARDIDSVAQAIRDNGAVLITVQGQNNGTWLTEFPAPPSRASRNALWEHFMAGLEPVLDPAMGKCIRCPQSWGRGAGRDGWQCLTEAYFRSGYVLDVQTYPRGVVDQEISIIKRLIILYRRLLGQTNS